MDASYFRRQAWSLFEQLCRWRRDIHAHPELELDCFRTGELVAAELERLGFSVRRGVARSGVVATLGASRGTVLALRFDMDALPLQEETGLPFSSTVPGRAHACGHDGHTAVGLGVAHILAALEKDLPGGVKLIFEPGEEYPGGARYLVAEGALEDPPVAAILGMHLFPGLPAHTIGIRYGPMTAQNDEFVVHVHGKGGHAAYPHRCLDPVVAAAALIMNLQTIVSRSVSPLESAVVTVAEVRAGAGHNVIPESAVLRGTVRTLDAKVRERVLKRLEAVVKGIEQVHATSCRLEVMPVEPLLVCDEMLTGRVEAALSELWAAPVEGERGLAAPRVVRLPEPSLGAEGFAYYATHIPATYVRFGVRDEEHPHELHTPRFDFDERVMVTAVASLSYVAWRVLEELGAR